LALPGGAAEAADFMIVFGPLSRVSPTLSAEARELVRATLETYFEGRDGPAGITLPAANSVVQAHA